MWGIRFEQRYLYPLLSNNVVTELKILISMNSSTSFNECDRLFVSQFLKFDSMIAQKIKRNQESISQLYGTLGSFTSQ